MAVALGVLGVPGMSAAEDAGSGEWYEVTLEEGETRGFNWAVGAKGRAHKPLKEICVLATFIAPPEPIPGGEATISNVGGSRKPYVRVRCGQTGFYPLSSQPTECGNPFTGDKGMNVIWHAAIRGAFFYTRQGAITFGRRRTGN